MLEGKTMQKRTAVLLLLAVMPLAELHAQSQQVSATFKVQARVEAVCSVNASNLDFGAYKGDSPAVGTTTIGATCTPGTTYNIGLNDGTGGGTIYGGRKMASGPANKLNYQLYRDSARANIWGNTTGTDTVQDVGSGLEKQHMVHGAIPAAQAVPAGSYEDTITVVVYY